MFSMFKSDKNLDLNKPSYIRDVILQDDLLYKEIFAIRCLKFCISEESRYILYQIYAV